MFQPNGDKDVLNIYQLPKDQSEGGVLLWTLDNLFSKDDSSWIEGKVEIQAQDGADYKVTKKNIFAIWHFLLNLFFRSEWKLFEDKMKMVTLP